jgi:hypothetical protein
MMGIGSTSGGSAAPGKAPLPSFAGTKIDLEA